MVRDKWGPIKQAVEEVGREQPEASGTDGSRRRGERGVSDGVKMVGLG